MKKKILVCISLLALAAAVFISCGPDDGSTGTKSSGSEAASSAETSAEDKEVFSVNEAETVLTFEDRTVTVSWQALEGLSCPVLVQEVTPFGDGELVSFRTETERLSLSGSVFFGLEEDLFDFEDTDEEDGAAVTDMITESLSVLDESEGPAEKTVSGAAFTFGEGFALPLDDDLDVQYVFYAVSSEDGPVVYLHADAAVDTRADMEAVSAAVMNWFEAVTIGKEG
ncbi:MAG: hypothetical protein IKG08_07280 [Eubacterium sp.]|nr:hypothetical protein [Eubacterium sp.]